MEEKLEKMVRLYINLGETDEAASTNRVLTYKKKRDLWWAIQQEIKDSPKAMKMRIFREAHPEKVFEQYLRQRDKHRELKREVLTSYGNGKCACVRCGEGRLACLSIDHIEGGGGKHRKGVLRSSSAFYSWLKAQSYPSGYQTLCMNCQFVKRFENEEHN